MGFFNFSTKNKDKQMTASTAVTPLMTSEQIVKLTAHAKRMQADHLLTEVIEKNMTYEAASDFFLTKVAEQSELISKELDVFNKSVGLDSEQNMTAPKDIYSALKAETKGTTYADKLEAVKEKYPNLFTKPTQYGA